MFPPVSGEMFLWRAKSDASDNKNRAHRYNPFLILDHFNDSTLLFIYTLFFYVYLICKYMPAFFVCLFVLRQPDHHCVSYVCVCRDDDVLYVSEGDSFEGECDDSGVLLGCF